jgi:hypothetical protein
MAREREDLASIDELLAGAADAGPAEPVAEPGRHARAGAKLWRPALAAAVAAGAVYVVLLPLGIKVAYLLLFAGFFALFGMRRAVKLVEAPPLAVGGVPAAPPTAIDPTQVADGLHMAVSRWDARLSWSERDPRRFESNVRPRLAEIVDERLRQRHGVSRVADPRRARELMGERLWAFLFAPLPRTPNPGELATVVEDMERL